MSTNRAVRYRLKYLVESSPSRQETRHLAPETEVSFVPMEAVGEYGGLALDCTKPLEVVTDGYTYFRDGDVVVAKITPCFENGKGAEATGLRAGVGFGTTELHVLRPRTGLDGRYLFYVTVSHGFRKLGEAEMYGAGGQKRVSERFVRDYAISLPPLKRQLLIAAFLDRETAKIDALIEKKRRLLDLLDEKRTALITHAVTRGLDPDAPMKDSGVKWLGETPEHWKVCRLRDLTPHARPIIYGIVLPGPHFEGGVPIVKGGDVSEHRLQSGQLNRTDPDIDARHDRSRLRRGDLVYSIRGSIGEVAMIPSSLEGANLTQDAARISYDASIVGLWLMYALRARPLLAQLESGTLGATIRGINIRDLRRLFLPIPPALDQHELATFLSQQNSKISASAAAIHHAIALLQEYRTALISAAVTGLLDIPGPVA